jgi:transposase
MNWRRGPAYGQDLRDRVLAAMGEPIRMVAARFGVSASYVSKVRSRLSKTGETAGPQCNQVAPRLAPLYEALRARVAEHSDATIAELRAWVAGEHDIAVSYPVMWKTLARLGLTLKNAYEPPNRTAPTSPKRAPHGPSECPNSTAGLLPHAPLSATRSPMRQEKIALQFEKRAVQSHPWSMDD